MGLKNLIGSSSIVRHSWLIIAVLFTFLLMSCSESEEATKEQSQGKEVTPKVENPSDQALTSFVGADTEPLAENSPAVSAQLAQNEKQIEALRTENTGLKQNIVKLEQESRTINTRLTETDLKYAVEKQRADSLDGLLNSSAVSKPIAKNIVVESDVYPPSQSTYDNAMQDFRARKYDSALKGFKAIVQGGGKDELVSRSTYWLGETYFAQKKYKDALPLFQETLKIKNSEKKADAQYMIGRTYENLGSKAKAKAAYEKVVKNYPMSRNVKSAKARWAKL